MSGTLKLTFAALALLAFWLPASAAAQATAVDPELAARGKTLFMKRGCASCHTIGKGRMAGPDLLGVTVRRETAWLQSWLKDPEVMLASDSIAQALMAAARGNRMPKQKLHAHEIDALISYITQESERR